MSEENRNQTKAELILENNGIKRERTVSDNELKKTPLGKYDLKTGTRISSSPYNESLNKHSHLPSIQTITKSISRSPSYLSSFNLFSEQKGISKIPSLRKNPMSEESLNGRNSLGKSGYDRQHLEPITAVQLLKSNQLEPIEHTYKNQTETDLIDKIVSKTRHLSLQDDQLLSRGSPLNGSKISPLNLERPKSKPKCQNLNQSLQRKCKTKHSYNTKLRQQNGEEYRKASYDKTNSLLLETKTMKSVSKYKFRNKNNSSIISQTCPEKSYGSSRLSTPRLLKPLRKTLFKIKDESPDIGNVMLPNININDSKDQKDYVSSS